MPTPGIRSWFTRDVLELLERGSSAISRLSERLPQRLQGYIDLEALRRAGPIEAILLDDAEELFLNIDALLGDGSGRVLETVSLEMASRTLAQGAGVVVAGDLMGTVARMRAAVERPFVGVSVTYRLLSTNTGFTLVVGVPGRPRSARILRHFALGAIRAAQRFSRGADDESLKIEADTVGDRTTISAHYRSPPVATAPVSPRTRRPSRSMRAVMQPNLSEEVERILARSATEPPPVAQTRRSRTDPPPAHARRPSSPPEPSLAPPRVPNPTSDQSSGPRARRTTRPDPGGPEDDADRPTPLTGEDPSRKRQD